MIIGPKELLRLVKNIKLVENLSERELTNPEGAGFDVRVKKIYKLKKTKSFLGVDERSTPDVREIKFNNKNKKQTYELKPGEYVLAETFEKVNLPSDITAHPYARSTLHRSGISFLSNQVAPGYCGPLIFGLKNLGTVPLVLEIGARFAHLQFEYVLGGGSKYRGQWQGGRVAATKKEKQV
jgi:deoxycytidine triphosphate deaminase